MYTMLDSKNRIATDGNLIMQKFIEYVPRSEKTPFAYSVTQERFKLAWPLSDRDFIICTSFRYESQHKRYIGVRKSAVHKNVPPIKGVVRGVGFSGYVIEELGATKCRVQQITYVFFFH